MIFILAVVHVQQDQISRYEHIHVSHPRLRASQAESDHITERASVRVICSTGMDNRWLRSSLAFWTRYSKLVMEGVGWVGGVMDVRSSCVRVGSGCNSSVLGEANVGLFGIRRWGGEGSAGKQEQTSDQDEQEPAMCSLSSISDRQDMRFFGTSLYLLPFPCNFNVFHGTGSLVSGSC